MASTPASLAEGVDWSVAATARRGGFLRAFGRNRPAMLGLVMLVALLLLAGVGPLFSPYDPYTIALTEKHQPPALVHPLGTDFFGRDVLTRLMYGLRTSLAIAVLTVSIGVVIGVTLGLLSSYFGRTVDLVLMRVTDAFLAFPALLFALAIMAVRGPGFENLLLALVLKEWTGFSRLARAEGLRIREMEFVQGARVLGAGDRRIILRHILPNAISTVIVFATLALPIPILAEAALSFLGLGLPVDTPSLGNMINIDRGYMRTAWWAVTFPGLAVALTVLAFNFLGDGVRDALDPRLQS